MGIHVRSCVEIRTLHNSQANNYVLSWIDATQQWEPRSVAAAQGNLTEGDAIAFAIALGG